MFQNFKCYDMNFDLKFVIHLLCELISFQKKKKKKIEANQIEYVDGNMREFDEFVVYADKNRENDHAILKLRDALRNYTINV